MGKITTVLKTTGDWLKKNWKPLVGGIAAGAIAAKSIDVIVDKDEAASEPKLLEPNEEAKLIADEDSATVDDVDNEDADNESTPDEE